MKDENDFYAWVGRFAAALLIWAAIYHALMWLMDQFMIAWERAGWRVEQKRAAAAEFESVLKGEE